MGKSRTSASKQTILLKVKFVVSAQLMRTARSGTKDDAEEIKGDSHKEKKREVSTKKSSSFMEKTTRTRTTRKLTMPIRVKAGKTCRRDA